MHSPRGDDQEAHLNPKPVGVVWSKLRMPRLPKDVIDRRRPRAILESARSRPLLVVRAPAGYGKTTAVRQWLESEIRPSAWVTLDAGDNDPVVLVRHLLCALAKLEPLPEAERMLTSPGPLSPEALLSALSSDIESGRKPFVLVLDDVHVVVDPDSARLVGVLTHLVPEGSQLVLVGRSTTRLDIEHTIHATDALELEWGDLLYDEAEGVELLSRSLPHCGLDTYRDIMARTEGWPAGVHLAVLALRDSGERTPSLPGSGRMDRRTMRYFEAELLRALDPETREFLLRTSVLEQLCAPLCNATLEVRGSGSLLEELTADGNLFISGLGDDPVWYRYHPVFSDMLLTELRRIHPEEEASLRRRATEWLATHGLDDAAVRQAVATGDTEYAAAILYGRLHDGFKDGRVASIARWLDLFPASALRRDPLLMLSAAWTALTTGRREEMAYWLELLESAVWVGPLPDGTVSFEVGLAALLMTLSCGGAKATAENARVVREAGPQGSQWYELACLLGSVAEHVAGQVDDPVETFQRVELATRGTRAIHAVALSHLAHAELVAGQLAAGLEHAELAYEESYRGGTADYPMAAMVHCVRSYAAAFRGQSEKSERSGRLGRQQIALMNETVPRAGIHFRLILGDAALALGNLDVARADLEEAEALLPFEPDAVLLHDWVDALRKRIDRLASTSGPGSAEALTPAEQRVLEMLPTHLSLEEIAERLYVSRNTVKSHTVSIYRKLAVGRRGEAVERALSLGLLRD